MQKKGKSSMTQAQAPDMGVPDPADQKRSRNY